MNWLKKLILFYNSKIVKKTDYNAKIKDVEGKIPSVSDLVKQTDCNTKINEIKGEISDVSNLVKKQVIMLRSMRLMEKYPTLLI